MKERPVKLILALAPVALIIPAATPATAQRMTDAEREIAYYACRTEYVNRGMGNDDAANEYCTNKYYNEQPYQPAPKPPCSSFSDGCTRPD